MDIIERMDMVSTLFGIQYDTEKVLKEFKNTEASAYDMIISVLTKHKKCFAYNPVREAGNGELMIADYKQLLREFTVMIKQEYPTFTYDVKLDKTDDTIAHFKIGLNSNGLTQTVRRDSKEIPAGLFIAINRLFAKFKFPQRLVEYKSGDKAAALFLTEDDFIHFCRIIDIKNQLKPDKEFIQIFRSYNS